MIGITGIEIIVDAKTIDATFSGDLLYLSARIKLNTAAGIEYCTIITCAKKLSTLSNLQIDKLSTIPSVILKAPTAKSSLKSKIFVSDSL